MNSIRDKITLSMGAGGRMSSELMETVFMPAYGNDILNNLDDSAELLIGNARVAYTTDSYTVKPIFFPGGDIGKLSICGTVNDLSVKGAKPMAISAGFIIEDGFPIESLKKIVRSMKETSLDAGVQIVTGDTKVVSRGEADGIFINTSGIGFILPEMNVSCRNARVGDDVIISGSIGDHGMAIMNARENLGFHPAIQSDVAPIWKIVDTISGLGRHIHAMRDPTRGGVASVLNEIAKASRVNIKIFEKSLPIKDSIATSCNLLGLDPLYIANEGKVIIFCDHCATDEILKRVKETLMGNGAALIGKVVEDAYSDEIPPVCMETLLGTKRFVPLIEGEPLPRIC